MPCRRLRQHRPPRQGNDREPAGSGRTQLVEAHKLGGQAPTADIAAASETAQRVIENVARVIHAPRPLIARCAMGVLWQGPSTPGAFPGVGKPLPEAQLDRFTMRLTLGYPDARQEAAMLSEHAASEPIDNLRPVSTAAEIEAAIAAVKGVFVEESLHRYVVAILTHTRSDTRLSLGASPRSGISLLRVAKAHAVIEGRDYVTPGDVKAVAEDVLSHRVILAPEARTAGIDAADSIREALERTAIPV